MSERRDFITAPQDWTRVARQTADRVAYSQAIEGPEPQRSSWTVVDKLVAWGFAVFVAYVLAHMFCKGLKCVL